MRILITGGAGFIGSHLAEYLLERGEEVIVLDDLSTGCLKNIEHLASDSRFKFVRGSVLNRELVEEMVSDCDALFHLAAVVGVKLIFRKPVSVMDINFLGSKIVLESAARHGRKVLLISSSEVYGKGENVPLREEDDVVFGSSSKLRWCYGCSKLLSEFLALAYHRERGLPVVIVRPFNVIGPRQKGDYGMVLPRFIHAALKGEPLTVFGDGRQTRCFLYVTDFVSALVALYHCEAAVGKVVNIGGTEEITILALAEKVRQLANSRSEIVLIPYERAYERGFEDMPRRVPDISLAQRLIGFTPTVNLDEAIRRIIREQTGGN